MKAFAEDLEVPTATQVMLPVDLAIDDKRKYLARIPVELKLRVTAVNYSGPARSLNLSVTGLLVETRVPLTMGERMILTITNPERQGAFNVCAEVCRVATAATALQSGCYGLRVLTDDSLAWQNFLRMLVLK